jgi:hypothetical protein
MEPQLVALYVGRSAQNHRRARTPAGCRQECLYYVAYELSKALPLSLFALQSLEFGTTRKRAPIAFALARWLLPSLAERDWRGVTKNKEDAMRIKWTTLYVDDQEKALQLIQLTQLTWGQGA